MLAEKHALIHGMTINPNPGSPDDGVLRLPSLRGISKTVKEEKDLVDYILAHHGQVEPPEEVRYERNAVSR